MAKRAAEEARAQLGAEVERARSAVRAEQDQAVLMQKLEQFNLLRESNATLRCVVPGGGAMDIWAGRGGGQLPSLSEPCWGCDPLTSVSSSTNLTPTQTCPCSADNERAQRQVRELQQRLRSSDASQAPLQQRIRSLEAAAATAAAELSAAQDQAERWQKRAQQLMAKYESVDAQEHQRVLAELREAQDKQRAAEAAAAAATAEAATLQASLASEREALAALRQRLEEAEKENAASSGQAQELAKAKVGGGWWLVESLPAGVGRRGTSQGTPRLW